MTVLYFAWLRAKIGLDREVLEPPASVVTVADLIDWLAERSPGHAEAFGDLSCIRAAVNQEFVTPNAVIPTGAEVAFFPPVTGG